jgi:hypothetical protein
MTSSLQVGCAEFKRMQRREFLRVGGLGMMGLSLPQLFAAEARASGYGVEPPRARARSCILLFLAGGPSQLETFDPKPDAPSSNRTIFQTIPTNVPGTFLCEHLPDLARQANRYALIRSAWHRYGGHYGGHRYALSGHVAPGGPDQPARPDDRPGIVGLASRYLPPRNGMPSTIMLPWVATDQGSGASGGMGGGTLGRQYDPIKVEIDQATMDRAGRMPVFRVPEFALHPTVSTERFEERYNLLGQIDQQRRELADRASIREMGTLYQRASDLLTSPRIREGFNIDQEDRAVRQRYGLNAFGQSCLMARRLVERGVRLVQVNMARFVTMPGYGWDTHGKGEENLKNDLLPKLNAGAGSLIADLAERGLLDDTLVVVMGEFGRTPQVKRDGGRDHWEKCYSLLMAGGGVHGGMVYGRSDRTAA